MPSIASHFAVAKEVSKILNINTNDYLLGNILPDIINEKDSHMKIQGTYYLIPDIDCFIKNNKYSKDVFLGYLTHLLLDKYFLEEYIPNNIKEYRSINLFESKKIYDDYSSINYTLIKLFNIDVDNIVKIINDSQYELDTNKKEINIKSIRNTIICDSIYIDIDKYILFLNDTSIKIANDISRWCNYD